MCYAISKARKANKKKDYNIYFEKEEVLKRYPKGKPVRDNEGFYNFDYGEGNRLFTVIENEKDLYKYIFERMIKGK